MDDFYIYYEEVENQASVIGSIKAVAPIELKEMGDMNFIRVPPEVGLGFTRGTTPLNNWVVAWDSDAEKMVLKQEDETKQPEAPKILRSIPTNEEKPQITVTWKKSEGVFNVKARGVSISHEDIVMHFFVTRKDDWNILYYPFTVHLLVTMNRKGYDIPCDVELPDEFSVFTKYALERYQLRVEE